MCYHIDNVRPCGNIISWLSLQPKPDLMLSLLKIRNRGARGTLIIANRKGINVTLKLSWLPSRQHPNQFFHDACTIILF